MRVFQPAQRIHLSPVATQTMQVTNPSGFSPASLANLALWLDASNIAGVADGAAVSSWPDVSGNSKTVTQSTTANKPNYSTTTYAIGSKPSVYFPGTPSPSYLAAPGAILSGTSFSLFAVYRHLTDAGVKSIASQNDGSTGRTIFSVSSNLIRIFEGSGVGAVSGTTAISVNSNNVISFIRNGNNANGVKGYLNGVQDLQSTFSTTPPATTFEIGVNSNTSFGEPMTGAIAALLVYTRALSTTEQKQVESYLGTRYGITVS